ncbi:MAG: YidC/Oxa1 family membrane protein insertase [Clostridiales bacterium]|nr:YidC/Oxa1 family membrane protein insertase [Clostridiales bacterium]
MSFFSNIFGYVLNFIYEIVNNYGFALILFSILLKIILLPLSVKQQKTMKKTTKIQGKVKEIQDKYKNNPEKMNQEMIDLYKNENMSPFSGCLSSIIQIFLLLAIFTLVRSPLTYMKKIDASTMDNLKSYIKQEVGENSISQTYPEISVIKYVSKIKNNETQIKKENKNDDIEENIIEKDEEKLEENVTEEKKSKKVKINNEDVEKAYINMNLLGLDLSNIPWENKENITVFIIPLLYVISTFISMKITTNIGQNNKENEKKEIIIEKNESECKDEEVDMTAQMNQMSKNMSWFMPIMSVTIAMMAPLGLALYWLVNNILMIIERVILNKILNSKEEDENV